MARNTMLSVVVGLLFVPTGALAGFAGNALQFDGQDDFALVPDIGAFDVGMALTVEFWLRQDTFGQPESGEWLLTKMQNGCTTFGVATTSFDHTNAGFSNVPSGPTGTVGSGPIMLGEWFHVAFTVDTQVPIARLYINGGLVSEIDRFENGDPIPSLPLCENSAPILIGGFPPLPNNYLEGMIDEVRLWNVARSPHDVLENHNRLVDPGSAGLVGNWSFDENLGDQNIYDGSARQNHGFLGDSIAVAANDPSRVQSTAPIIPEPAPILLMLISFLPKSASRHRKLDK